MGGLHAAMVASVFPGDVGVTAWLAPPSAVPVFADGLLSGSCNWRSLYKQHELLLLDKMLQDTPWQSRVKIRLMVLSKPEKIEPNSPTWH